MEWGGGISSVREREDENSSIPSWVVDFLVSPQLSFLFPISPASPELLGGHGLLHIPYHSFHGSVSSWRGSSS